MDALVSGSLGPLDWLHLQMPETVFKSAKASACVTKIQRAIWSRFWCSPARNELGKWVRLSPLPIESNHESRPPVCDKKLQPSQLQIAWMTPGIFFCARRVCFRDNHVPLCSTKLFCERDLVERVRDYLAIELYGSTFAWIRAQRWSQLCPHRIETFHLWEGRLCHPLIVLTLRCAALHRIDILITWVYLGNYSVVPRFPFLLMTQQRYWAAPGARSKRMILITHNKDIGLRRKRAAKNKLRTNNNFTQQRDNQ